MARTCAFASVDDTSMATHNTADREISKPEERPPGSQSSNYKWLVVAVLFVAAGLNYADRAAPTGIFPLLGMSDVALASTSSLLLWSYAICSPCAGFIGDRFSRSSSITWSMAIWSFIVVLSGLAQTQVQFLGIRIALGIAGSLYVPAAFALIGDYHSSLTRGRAFAIHLCGFYTGMVAGSSLAGYLGERYGWRCPLLVLGGTGMLFAAVAAAVLHDEPGVRTTLEERKRAPRPALREMRESFLVILHVRSYWFLVTEAFLLAAVSFVLSTWLPFFFHEFFAMDLGRAGFRGTFALQAGGVAGVLLGGFVSDAVGRKNPTKRMLIQACCDLISAPMLLTFLAVPNVIAVESALLLFSFLRYIGGANGNPLICDLIRSEHRSLAFGIENLMTCLSAGAGVLLSGALKARFALTAIFAAISGIGVLSGFVLLAGYYFFLARDLERTRVPTS
jgi:MFS transporter, Spinster family, sphingosine-1-phosphate transporter